MPSRHPVEEDARYVLSPSVISTSLPGETVVLDPAAGQYFSVSGAGPRVWELLQSPTTIGAIVAALESEFEVDPAACARDVRALVEELLERGLVIPDPATP